MDFLSSYKITELSEHTYLIVAAVHKDGKSNILRKIPCHKCYPMGGYAFSLVEDCIYVKCVDCLDMGIVPVSFSLKLGSWSTNFPVPENVLSKYFTEYQKDKLNEFKEVHDAADFDLDFIQALVA